MRVTVLCGGPSAERNISLISGNAVADGLLRAGHHVQVFDVAPDDLSALDEPADVIFPVLHGRFGESGELQEILEDREMRFVGSGSAASRHGMNKVRAKIAWRHAGLPTPEWEVIAAREPARSIAAAAPCVVKPVDSGSSIDVCICHTAAEARAAAERLVEQHGSAMLERKVQGTELTFGFLNDEVLPPIRIVPHAEFFDFHAKYEDRQTEYRFDLGLDDDVVERATEVARRAYDVIGCRDIARLDMIVDASGTPQILEINTIPGFTAKSLLPMAAKRRGIGFNTLVDGLVVRAASRRRIAAAASSPSARPVQAAVG